MATQAWATWLERLALSYWEPGDMQTQAAGEADRAPSPSAAALYIATLSNELAQIARRHRLDVLAHILEMARLEAEQIAKSSADASGRAA